MTYEQAINKCSDLYQSTYGTKNVEEMSKRTKEFLQYQYDVVSKFKVSIERVRKDTNNDYTARYYDKR